MCAWVGVGWLARMKSEERERAQRFALKGLRENGGLIVDEAELEARGRCDAMQAVR